MIKDPGELNEQIAVLALQQDGNVFDWTEQSIVWAKAELQEKKNLFSQVGIGVKSVKFTVWKRDITLHNAFLWQGKHCFLTDITDADFLQYEVTAALIEPQVCSIQRTTEPVRNELNRPVYAEPTVITFPACVTEKYLGHTQDRPMAVTETTYVLITPKVIALNAGELVTVGGVPYKVLVLHQLDEYKNEYEISREANP